MIGSMIKYRFSNPKLDGICTMIQLDSRGIIITVTGDAPCTCGKDHRMAVTTHMMITMQSFSDHIFTSAEWMLRGQCSNATIRARAEAEKLTLHMLDKYKGTCPFQERVTHGSTG